MTLFNIDKQAVGNRLIELEKELGIKSSRQFALSIKMDPSYLGKVQRGETAISKKYIDRLAKLYKINTEWLLHGKGEKYGINVPHETTEILKNEQEETNYKDKYISLLEETLEILKKKLEEAEKRTGQQISA